MIQYMRKTWSRWLFANKMIIFKLMIDYYNSTNYLMNKRITIKPYLFWKSLSIVFTRKKFELFFASEWSLNIKFKSNRINLRIFKYNKRGREREREREVTYLKDAKYLQNPYSYTSPLGMILYYACEMYNYCIDSWAY